MISKAVLEDLNDISDLHITCYQELLSLDCSEGCCAGAAIHDRKTDCLWERDGSSNLLYQREFFQDSCKGIAIYTNGSSNVKT